jgi:hypothetical protein
MRGVDLLPKEVAKPKRPSLFGVTAVATILFFVLIMSSLYMVKTAQLNRAQEAFAVLESDFLDFAWIDEELIRTAKSKKDIESKVELARKETENPLPVDRILKELPGLMPQGVRLVQFSLASEGRILCHAEATTLSQAAGLAISLEQSGMFHDVKLLKVTRVNDAGGTYKLDATGKLSPRGGD